MFCYFLRILLHIEDEISTAQKMKFSIKVFSVNLIKSAVSCGFGHIYTFLCSVRFGYHYRCCQNYYLYVFNIHNNFINWFMHVSLLREIFFWEALLIMEKCFFSIKWLRTCLGCSYCILGCHRFLWSFDQTDTCLVWYFSFELLSHCTKNEVFH